MNLPRLSLRRSHFLVALMCILGIVFAARLFYLQVLQHDFYEAEAAKEHTTKFTIPAKRGLIYAHDGSGQLAKLVLNEPVFTVYADPRYIKDPTKTADVLRRVAGGNLVDGFATNLEKKDLQYTVLARQVTKAQADLIKKENLEGIGFQENERRVYPEGALAAQILGFVNQEGKGQYGIEQALNGELSGREGLLRAVTDVYGIPLSVGPESVLTPPEDGKNLVLTIDRNIQNKVEQALRDGLQKSKATIGSVLVMDPRSGAVLAMANLPTYDPANYTKIDDYQLFGNRVVGDAYEPGSVIKSLTMGIGLNEGVVEPGSTYNNTGSTQVADATIKNVLTSPQGRVTMTQVLEFSFNTGMVHVLRLLGGGDISFAGKQKLYQYFTDRYFFGLPTGISLMGEAGGQVIPPDDADGGPVRYANMTFGQGMTATMLQVTAAFAASVNGGQYYSPQILDGYLEKGGSYSDKPAELRKTDVITPQASQKLRSMLQTARSASFVSAGDKKGYTIGGKTGTAQVYDPKTGKYSETETIGSYVGFGGQNGADYVIMVRVDDAKISGFSGSVAAAPIFTEISNWMIDYMQIKPN